MLVKRNEPVANQIGRGFVASIQQENAIMEQFFRGQTFRVVASIDEPGENVAFRVARIRAALADKSIQINKKVFDRGIAAFKYGRGDNRLQGSQDPERPIAQRFTFFMGHAKQVAEDFNRDRGSELFNQVAFTLLSDAGDQLIDERYETCFHFSDCAWRQRADDQAANPVSYTHLRAHET